MKDYDMSAESSWLMCWDVKNLYGWPMSQKLYVDGFKWKQKKFKFTQKFIQNYDDDSNKEYNLQVHISYPDVFRRYTLISCSWLKEQRSTKALKVDLDYRVILQKMH